MKKILLLPTPISGYPAGYLIMISSIKNQPVIRPNMFPAQPYRAVSEIGTTQVKSTISIFQLVTVGLHPRRMTPMKLKTYL